MGDLADARHARRPDQPDGAEHETDDFGDRLYRLALRITGVTEDAEGAVDDALRNAAAATRRFPGESGFESWLYREVACAAYQKLRRRRQHVAPVVVDDVLPPLNDDDGHFEPMDDWSDRIGAQALQGRLRGVVTAAIDALPPDARTALILHDVEGAASPDIAEILGVDISAVKAQVHRARLFVRKRLSEHFAAADAA